MTINCGVLDIINEHIKKQVSILNVFPNKIVKKVEKKENML